jgi:hypothetical protein
MNTAETYQGWACVDCLFLLANGETPEGWTEEETQAWLAKIERRADGGDWELGGEHDDDCPNVDHETGQWLGNADCWCEHQEFSWSSCDVCGSQLGGSRDAVTWYPRESA